MEHTLFLTKYGILYSCGNCKHRSCGYQSDKDIKIPINIATKIKIIESIKFIDISVGDRHNLCLTSNNKLYVFGDNGYGKLGLRTSLYGTWCSIQLCSFFDTNKINVCKICTGSYHSFVINDKNKCYGFGYNRWGSIGVHTEKLKIDILKILKNMGISEVHCGNVHTVILTKSNELYTLGSNNANEVSITNKKNKIWKPHHLTRDEIGINENCIIDSVIAGYESTLVVVDE